MSGGRALSQGPWPLAKVDPQAPIRVEPPGPCLARPPLGTQSRT